MRQIISTALLLTICQVVIGQEVVDDVAEEPVVTSSTTYDVQLFAASAEGDSAAQISFESQSDSVFVALGEFELNDSGGSYVGSWFGAGWGPLTYRFGGATSVAGDNLLLGSLTFGDVIIGRAITFGSDSQQHFFVFGMMTDDLAIPEEEDPPSQDVEGEEPVEGIPVDVPMGN